MELKETVAGMTSHDYKERFKAEYQQTKIRHTKLKALLNRWDAWKLQYVGEGEAKLPLENALGFNPSCSYEILREQQACMGQYLHCLEVRAVIEGIELD